MDHPVWRTADSAHEWLETTNGKNDEQTTMHILKLSEEIGEVAEAWIGARGQNPRKGVTHTRDQVAAELGDVVITALVALRGLGHDPRAVLAEAAERVGARAES